MLLAARRKKNQISNRKIVGKILSLNLFFYFVLKIKRKGEGRIKKFPLTRVNFEDFIRYYI